MGTFPGGRKAQAWGFVRGANHPTSLMRGRGAFDDMQELRRLALFWNMLPSLPSLKSCALLEEVLANGNKLQEFPELGSHPHLRIINVNRNMIKVLTALPGRQPSSFAVRIRGGF